jgi:hypothetical protein
MSQTSIMDFFPESRDDLEVGQDMCDDRDMIEYHDALDAAEAAGEPSFTFAEFLDRIVKQCPHCGRTLSLSSRYHFQPSEQEKCATVESARRALSDDDIPF